MINLTTINKIFSFIMNVDDITIDFKIEDFPNANLTNHITTEFYKVPGLSKHNKWTLKV